jgi:hypothetical protein
VVLGVLVLATGASPRGPEVLFSDAFQGPDGLVTNEYATGHPGDPHSRISPRWIVTSGSLFRRGDAGTDGPIDRSPVGPDSTSATDSAVFRAYTRARFDPSYSVRFEARVAAPVLTGGPAWDGFHVIVGARSAAAAYYVSVARRDHRAVIKKKTAGGPVAGGFYAAISAYRPFAFPAGRYLPVRVDVTRNDGGSVSIDLYVGGRPVVSATDDDHAFTGPGRVGLRADWTQIWVRDFRITRAPSP